MAFDKLRIATLTVLALAMAVPATVADAAKRDRTRAVAEMSEYVPIHDTRGKRDRKGRKAAKRQHERYEYGHRYGGRHHYGHGWEHDYGWQRPVSMCRPRRAIRKAMHMGVQYPDIRRINGRVIVVSGYRYGHPVRIAFARHGRHCPVIRVRGI